MDNLKFKQGMKIHACLPGFRGDIALAHIDHILPSVSNPRSALVVYRAWSKHRKNWFEDMCSAERLQSYIEQALIEKKILKQLHG